MKKFIPNACSAILLGLITLVSTNSSMAQAVTGTPAPSTTVSTTATGSIARITADMLYIKADGDPAPVGYIITKTTTYIDDQEAPVQMSLVKPGRAVVVYYVMEKNNRVATKVLVRNAP